MRTSNRGRSLITLREGSRTTAYQDSVGVWTIGVGHTAAAGEPHPKRGMTITTAEVDEILQRDLRATETVVDRYVTVPLEQHEFDALVSLVFNVGSGAFSRSTVRRRLNAGNRRGAADAFLMWNKAGGRVVAGLTTRRRAEREQFLGIGE